MAVRNPKDHPYLPRSRRSRLDPSCDTPHTLKEIFCKDGRCTSNCCASLEWQGSTANIDGKLQIYFAAWVRKYSETDRNPPSQPSAAPTPTTARACFMLKYFIEKSEPYEMVSACTSMLAHQINPVIASIATAPARKP